MDIVNIRIWESTRGKLQLLSRLAETSQVAAMDKAVTKALEELSQQHPEYAPRIQRELAGEKQV